MAVLTDEYSAEVFLLDWNELYDPLCLEPRGRAGRLGHSKGHFMGNGIYFNEFGFALASSDLFWEGRVSLLRLLFLLILFLFLSQAFGLCEAVEGRRGMGLLFYLQLILLFIR